MSFVPSQTLEKLICINCKKYLSHFPIYFQPDRGSFCGRCPRPEDVETVGNEVYEYIAQTLKFPCCYSSNGCTENLTPSKIPQHEKYCPYMKCDCPSFCSTTCTWQGFVKDIPEHFEERHPTLFLKEAKFEVDFINSYEENCLLPYGEEIFIVNRISKPTSNIFSCSVNYLGTNPTVGNYTYKIVLENEKRSHAHVILNKLDVKKDIKIDDITSVLNNPSSVIATIEILEHKDTVDSTEDDSKYEGNNDVDYDLIKELECVVCFEYMLPPIHQCLIGHSICLKCKNDVDKCPTCESEFQNTQNFTLGRIINLITYPCKNKRCNFASKAKDIKQHEASCTFGSIKCPLYEYEDCCVDIIFSEIHDHLINNHSENLLEMDTVTTPFDFEENQSDEDCYIIKHASRLFKLHYWFADNEFMWAMQLIGRPEECTKFMFEIDIIDNSGKNQRAYFRSYCSPLTDKGIAFDNHKSFIFINYDQIKTMITNDFSYRVRILQA